MIINVDAKSLEWCTYLFLSQDKVGIEEWIGVINDPTKNDIHRSNQEAFALPSRLIAKIFLFRWIYRGSAFAYSRDPDFTGVSRKPDFWQDVIDRYYTKYHGIYDIHMRYIKEATTTGSVVSPFGREYTFHPKVNYKGEIIMPESDIVNWPNQGVGADVMAVARVAVRSRLKRYNVPNRMVNTVHDSLVADAPEKEKDFWIDTFCQVFKDLPKLIEQAYGVPWNVPMLGEASVGSNMKDLVEVS